MNRQQIAAFCLQLPGAREDFKWGENQVFSIAGNKMFAILNFLGGNLAFKVDKDLFLGFVDRPGIRPAPYLARAHWISMDCDQLPIGDQELRELLTRSHQLVVAKLSKRKQLGLLIDL
ncbi:MULTISPECIES: MmcQ/YjbR family DNA-binding protein [Pseudomonas]|uniref:Predicted DNA-binding protein, MmcQ/YjbR family n=1 Tax=Pseudomonas segetis TaxID=298908 RepID=A0A239J6K0_9PSED|nr:MULTISPECIES: MmcQ/YjbR family DNA-binding protein [Pseudomonas]SNT01098.1 Predicted DNA-binding protein, MmcQ/YjbR family [Pseudomonas segetis]